MRADLCPYVAGAKSELHLDEENNRVFAGHGIEFEILEVFEPITFAPVMKVKLAGREEPLVLKLFDRRFNPGLRKKNKDEAWDEEREKEFVDFVRDDNATISSKAVSVSAGNASASPIATTTNGSILLSGPLLRSKRRRFLIVKPSS